MTWSERTTLGHKEWFVPAMRAGARFPYGALDTKGAQT